MFNNKVSIIVPIYNVSNYIRACLDSLINQTHKNIEIILVNDGTKDDSIKKIEDIIKKDTRVILYNKENGGLSDARNYGLSKSTGEYIYFIDSDDYIDHETIEKLVNQAEISQATIVKMNYNKVYHNDDYTVDKIKPNRDIKSIFKVMDGKNFADELIKSKAFNPMVWLYLYEAKYIKENKFKFEKNVYHEDELWTPKVLMEAPRVVQINFKGYYYVQREGSIMRSDNNHKRYEDMKKNILNLEKYYLKYDDTYILRDYLARQYISIRKLYPGSKREYIKNLDKEFLKRNIYFKSTKIKYLLSIYMYPVYKFLS